MRSLDEIKRECFIFSNKYLTDEEIKYYSITEEKLKEWRTEKCINYKNELFDMIDSFDYILSNTEDKAKEMYSVNSVFSLSVYDRKTEDSYYYEIPKIFKKMYENDMFDYLSYDEYLYGNEYRTSIRFANQEKSELETSSLKYENQKYSGIIPLIFYSNHLDVFKELLEYFANTIYQKYGLYLQYSMNILIKFCKEYNLPYVDMLESAKRKAKELDYPAHHKYKYQFIKRKEVIWEYKNQLLRTIEQIKSFYCDTMFTEGPRGYEAEYHSITEDTLKKWRTERLLDNRDNLYDLIDCFETSIKKFPDNKTLILSSLHSFKKCTTDYKTEESYYYEIPKIFKKMYENDMFDFLIFEEWMFNNLYESRIVFANEEKKEIEELYNKGENKKYAGAIPALFYSNHLDIFKEVLEYFANTIYQKYGLYLQYSMNILIKFCKEYNLPYVDMLENARRKAKELDYPAHHKYKYQFYEVRKENWK